MIRIALVDDHALIRRGLCEALSSEGDIEVIAEAADYTQWRELQRQHKADVLVLDLNLPGRSGIEILQLLQTEPDAPAVVVLSQYPEDQYGIRALKAGARAYLNKSVDPAELLQAVRTVASGQKYVTPQIAIALMESVVDNRPDKLHEALSERELQTMVMIARGVKPSQIASALNLSPKTISVYRGRILAKLQIGSNAEIASYAVRHNLIGE